MNLKRTITTQESENVVRDRIASYLEKLGYKRVNSESSLTYERGSVLGSFTSFSPKGWQVKANVEISTGSDQMTVASVNLDINTTGQLVTEKERLFWSNELDGLETAVRTDKVDVASASKAAQSSLAQNLMAAAVILGLTIVLAVIARLLFESRVAFYTGGALGLMLGFMIARQWLKF
jgi:hypothetical protein